MPVILLCYHELSISLRVPGAEYARGLGGQHSAGGAVLAKSYNGNTK